jgi:predicted DCC family thiol-disulfide oxidoreductase YuxK
VASVPPKPLMIYDGDCNFCKFWVTRWQHATEGRVDFINSQKPRVAAEFPELRAENFAESVQFIETDGRAFSGAEAVFRSLTHARGLAWPLWIYRDVPGFAPVAERCYRFVAGHREGFSALTRLLWGRDGALPSHQIVRSLFLRLLGLIYLCAFVSLGTQVIGLIGHAGIEPANQYMAAARGQLDQMHMGIGRYHLLPTLCWLSASDGFLRGLCWSGVALSLLLVAGILPAPCLFLLWLIYLSLSAVGGVFLEFQWDTLLLEAGFLAIFFAPLRWTLGWSGGPAPSKIALWLLRWLLFRLMLESGMVKLLSGDPLWRHLAALTVHYQTQPLPTWIGWYAHQLPAGFQEVSVAVMFFIELAVPFLIFAPRRLRFAGCALLVFLQICILLTGNYCFFNLLTIAFCLLLLDDAALRSLTRRTPGPACEQEHGGVRPLSGIEVPAAPVPRRRTDWPWWITGPIAAVILLVTVTTVLQMAWRFRTWPEPADPTEPPRMMEIIEAWIEPFRSVNNYGLFAVMTNPRMEISVQGSDDGQNWRDYTFKYKPGDPKMRPAFVAPHQPRLDWQMWFAALGTYRENRWFVEFCVRLLQGSPDVLGLLERNPFPNAPPKYIRAELYEYRFSTFAERREKGVWWVRESRGDYLPAISLK